jgi:hypothetical protein
MNRIEQKDEYQVRIKLVLKTRNKKKTWVQVVLKRFDSLFIFLNNYSTLLAAQATTIEMAKWWWLEPQVTLLAFQAT